MATKAWHELKKELIVCCDSCAGLSSRAIIVADLYTRNDSNPLGSHDSMPQRLAIIPWNKSALQSAGAIGLPSLCARSTCESSSRQHRLRFRSRSCDKKNPTLSAYGCEPDIRKRVALASSPSLFSHAVIGTVPLSSKQLSFTVVR